MQKIRKSYWTILVAIGFSLTQVGCFATSVKNARIIPAEYSAGTRLKTVSVFPFYRNGKVDLESTAAIKSTVAGIRIDNENYFKVAERDQLNKVIKEQSYARTGQFDARSAAVIGKKLLVKSVLLGEIESPTMENIGSYKTDKGVTCTTYSVNFSFTPSFVNVETGISEYATTVSKSATDTICGGSKRPNKNALWSEARSSAMRKFRDLIAPRTESESIRLLTDYCKPDDKKGISGVLSNVSMTQCDDTLPDDYVIQKINSGEKFAGSNRMDRACELWSEAEGYHDVGYNIPYLLGVCAEMLEGDLRKAKRYYQTADKRSNEPVSAINDALSRVDGKSSDNLVMGKKPRQKSRPSPQTTKVQSSLTELGYDPGPVDGFMGKKTRDAILEFQLDNGLEGTRKLDSLTLGALGVS